MPQKSKLTFSNETLKGGSTKRLSQAILYVCTMCEQDEGFGATRLNKILFEADFQAFYARGVAVTGARYQRLENGPAPKAMLPCLREMKESGDIAIRERDYFGRPQTRIVPLVQPDLSLFGPDDIAFLSRAIHDSWGKSGTRVSIESHRIEWETRKNGDPIPYEAVWLSNAPVSRFEAERTKELAASFGW